MSEGKTFKIGDTTFVHRGPTWREIVQEAAYRPFDANPVIDALLARAEAAEAECDALRAQLEATTRPLEFTGTERKAAWNRVNKHWASWGSCENGESAWETADKWLAALLANRREPVPQPQVNAQAWAEADVERLHDAFYKEWTDIPDKSTAARAGIRAVLAHITKPSDESAALREQVAELEEEARGAHGYAHDMERQCKLNDATIESLQRELTALRSQPQPIAWSAERVSAACQGERCSMCGDAAEKKVGEEILFDDANPGRHNLTAYVCKKHFDQIMNGTPAEPAPQPAPELSDEELGKLLSKSWCTLGQTAYGLGSYARTLLAQPQQRRELADEELIEIWNTNRLGDDGYTKLWPFSEQPSAHQPIYLRIMRAAIAAATGRG